MKLPHLALALALLVACVSCNRYVLTGDPVEIDTRERLESDDVIKKNLFQYYNDFKRKRNQNR